MEEMEKNHNVTLKVKDKDVVLTKEFLSFETFTKVELEEKYVPSVIEPSFGIGRIVYCIFEHCFKVRPEDQ